MKQNKRKVSFSKRCLISIDLDGTLLNSKAEVTSFTKKVIRALSDRGHIVCINTARPYNACDLIYHDLNLTTPIITHNGAFMFCPSNKEFPIASWFLSKDVVNAIFKDKNIMSISSAAVIDAEKRTYVIACDKSLLKKKTHNTSALKKVINTFGIFTTDDIIRLHGNINNFDDTGYAILISPRDESHLMDLINAIKTKVPTVVTSIWRVAKIGIVVKVSTPYCSKGMSLRLVSSYYGIPESRCYAFGDGLDDADMLKFASNGYVMKNGCNEAQMRANFVTKYNNDNDGVARELNRIFKLGYKEN